MMRFMKDMSEDLRDSLRWKRLKKNNAFAVLVCVVGYCAMLFFLVQYQLYLTQ